VLKKLSYKEQRELETLPKKLEELETELEAVQAIISDADFYSKEMSQTQPVLDKLSAIEADLEEAFTRWEELESKQNNV
jgi:ATP-binding cassette subfamily F protein uup